MEAEISTAIKVNPPQTTNINLKPGTLSVIRRNGRLVPFDANRIASAITKAFWEVEKTHASTSTRLVEIVNHLTQEVTQLFMQDLPINGGTIHIEEVQNKVEQTLMAHQYYQVARSYIIYREEHRKLRETQQQFQSNSDLNIILDDGTQTPLDISKLETLVTEACQGLEFVSASVIVKDTLRSLFDGVHIRDVRQALIMTARTYIEQEPAYSYVAARLLLNNLQLEATRFLNLPVPKTYRKMAKQYAHTLSATIERGIELERLDPRLQTFDLPLLGQAIRQERDFAFTYLGLQTLYDRYFLHNQGTRFELPQIFFMRVAMGLALEEKDKNQRAIEFYETLSSFNFMSSTPTLFNSGTLRSQLSSCFLSTVPDDLAGIYDAIKDNALLSKFAGGLGNDWTPVRAMGAHIKGTNGQSQGVPLFLKVANDTTIAVNQGGKRKGALCCYLETWHLDIEEFLELRKNTGDDRRRTHDMNTANWVPDLFMKRVIENQDWTLFSPDETPDLHDLYGDAFESAYVAYEQKADQGKISNFKRLPAVVLWRKMLGMLYETGHPWITFKDPCNLRSPQPHAGVIHSSNLCTEITLNTSADEIAVCNLGSINLAQHLTEEGLDIEKLYRTIKTAIRMLDNVIDINFYPVPQAKRSNLRHRPVGLGIMGFQDVLYTLGYSYESPEAVEFADRSMEHISYAAISASVDLAAERGVYPTFEGSLWSQGILPIYSIERLQESRGMYLDQDRSQTLDWDALRKRVQTIGMRNSNVMAIAPTATISNVCGVTQSIEPTYQNLFVKSNLSGEFTVINPYLVSDLKKLGLWDTDMVKDLKYFNGSVRAIDRIPASLKSKYATVFEIDPMWLIDAASRRQKWIDQAQSLNLYMAAPSGKKLDVLYRSAWLRGLKTTYYLRSLGATDAEKSTINESVLNAVPPSASAKATADRSAKAPDFTQAASGKTAGLPAEAGRSPAKAGPSCSIDNPDCEACQ